MLVGRENRCWATATNAHYSWMERVILLFFLCHIILPGFNTTPGPELSFGLERSQHLGLSSLGSKTIGPPRFLENIK